MKKWLYLAGALAAVGILARLPHPARDISALEPVRAVYIYKDGGRISIETDTGDSGTGKDLPAAAAQMKAASDREIFLDTAEFLILDRRVPVDPALFDLLRPGCRVVFSGEKPDMETISDFLAVHKPETSLAELRPGNHSP